MKISYITMQFPVPSETFASLDVESLRQQWQEVSVYGMRPKHVQFKKLMVERGHSGLSVTHFSFVTIFVFFFFLIRHPLMTFSLLGWVFSYCARTPTHLLKSLILLPSAISIFSSVLTRKPDVVHLFWGHYPSMVGYMVKRYMPNTVLSMFLGAHDLLSAYPGSVKLSKEADEVFTHSKSNLPIMREMGIDVGKVNVVVRGTKLEPVQNFNITKFQYLASPKIITASRLVERKGVDDVLNIFKIIVKEFPKAELFVAGGGESFDSLILQSNTLGISESVKFLGHLPQKNLLQLMKDCQYFILMSKCRDERLPNVIKESMYQGCISISTNTTGINELIDNDVDGYIVDFGVIESTAKIILESINDPVSTLVMAKMARKKIENRFNVDLSMAKYIDLWGGSLKVNKSGVSGRINV